jgi:hypothetical protein
MKKITRLFFVVALVLSFGMLLFSSVAAQNVSAATATRTRTRTATIAKTITKTPTKTVTKTPTLTATLTPTATPTQTQTPFYNSPRYIYYSAIWHECYFAVIELAPDRESEVNNICRDYLQVALKNDFYKYRLSDGFLKPLPTDWDMTRTPSPTP